MYRSKQCVFLIYALAFGFLTHAQPTTFEFFLKSTAYESAGLSFENSDGFYYFLGAREDTLSINGLFDILLLKVSQSGDTITHLEHSPDTSVGVGYLKESGNNFLGIGSYHFNNGSTGGMYNITFNTNLEVLSKKVLPFPEAYYFLMSSARKVLTDRDNNFIYIRQYYNLKFKLMRVPVYARAGDLTLKL